MEGQKCSQNGHQNGLKTARIAIVMVPFQAQSHLNQLLHLAHRINSYDIPIHFAGSTTHNRQVKLRFHGRDPECLSKIHFHDFDLPPFSSPPPNPNAETQFPAHLQPVFNASLHLHQPVSQLLKELATKFRRVVVIHDIAISSVVQEVKCIPNAEAYSVLPISAFTMFWNIWDSMPDKPFQLDIGIPNSLPTYKGGVTQELLEFMEHQRKFMDFQSGRLYNTCRLIEGKYVELLQRLPNNDNLKHFVIGPNNPVEVKSSSNNQRHECLEWLDKQERDSVIYVSFGLTTSITDEQIRELAQGLESSGVKFLWVLRDADRGDIFTEDEARQPQLPEGYEERVKNRGIVVKDWAPQLEILGHQSTGGFMTHCGWNSCLESISMGVPVAAWPMHSDQPRNAVLLTEELRIGIMVRYWSHPAKLVTSDTIESAVRRLMATEEGAETRKRAAELGEGVRGSVAYGGASYTELENFIAHITR